MSWVALSFFCCVIERSSGGVCVGSEGEPRLLASVNKEVSTDRWIPTAAKQYTRRAIAETSRLGRTDASDRRYYENISEDNTYLLK